MPQPTIYTPTPFVRPAYVPDQTNLLALMQAASQARQQATLQRGAQTAQGRYQLAALLTEAFDSIQKNQDRKAAMALAQQKSAQEQADKDRDFALRSAQFDDVAAQRAAAQAARDEAIAEKNALRVGQMAPGPISQDALDAGQADPVVAGRTRYSFGPGTTEGPELLPTPEQQRMTAAEAFAKEQGGVIGPNGQVMMPPKPVAEPREPNPTEASLALLAANGNIGAKRALEIMRAQRPPKDEPIERPSVWVGKGTDTRYVTPSEAARLSLEGWKSGNTREQGRPVTSGDAGRIADLDTSLDDLDVLSKTVTGSTGTAAKVGSMLPNWVTELTGRGSSAKQKQAAIDRVKQVIGKALEGGVLRKEDELKYEKILPTIYDPPDVVTSKLAGLQDALTKRRQTMLEALHDAGYEVGKYQERTRKNATPAQAETGFIEAVDPQGNVHHAPAGTPLPAGWKRK